MSMVYLVGAGPWDPGLLTRRGAELLQRADVVVFDYLVNPELVELARPEAERIFVGRPPKRMSQAEIQGLLVERAQAGQVVVRLKGGDPFVFGRGGEAAEVLAAAGVDFEVVPGVTAAIAGASFAGIPVTHREHGSTLAFCTGHPRADGPESDVDWAGLARISTVVFYMGARRLDRIAQNLLDAGRDPETPVALVRWATRPDQQTRVATLKECAAGLDPVPAPPLTIIVGTVVTLRQKIDWFSRKPLHGKRVVVTRSKGQQGPLAGRLADLGAGVLGLPTIAFETHPDQDAVRAAIDDLGAFDWVLFTSANGVDYFLDALYAAGRDPRAFGTAQVACIGPATARRLRTRGLVCDLVPEEYVAEGFIDALAETGVEGQKVLIPRAEVAREVLPDTLRAKGADVQVLPVYRTVPPAVDDQVRAQVLAGEADLVTFTASSTVRHFCAMFSEAELAEIQTHIQAACIGPITGKTASERGFTIATSATTYTIPGLVDAIRTWAATA